MEAGADPTIRDRGWRQTNEKLEDTQPLPSAGLRPPPPPPLPPPPSAAPDLQVPKVPLMVDAFDPARVARTAPADRLYMCDPEAGAYVLLTEELVGALNEGRVRI